MTTTLPVKITHGDGDNYAFLSHIGGQYGVKPYVSLYMLHVSKKDRRKGVGRSLVKSAMEYAETHQRPLVLCVGPFADMPMNVEQLTTFYERCGFKKSHGNYMVWEPK